MRFRGTPGTPDLCTLVLVIMAMRYVSLVCVFVCEYVRSLTVIDFRATSWTRCPVLLARALAGFHSQGEKP